MCEFWGIDADKGEVFAVTDPRHPIQRQVLALMFSRPFHPKLAQERVADSVSTAIIAQGCQRGVGCRALAPLKQRGRRTVAAAVACCVVKLVLCRAVLNLKSVVPCAGKLAPSIGNLYPERITPSPRQ